MLKSARTSHDQHDVSTIRVIKVRRTEHDFNGKETTNI